MRRSRRCRHGRRRMVQRRADTQRRCLEGAPSASYRLRLFFWPGNAPGHVTDIRTRGHLPMSEGTTTWISDWNPEDEKYWNSKGKFIARRNLIWSIVAENIGFSVWLIWSI